MVYVMNFALKKNLCFPTVLSIALAIFSVAICQAEIVEKKNITSIAEYVKINQEGLCVVFDLDNTTMRPIKDEGSDEWFSAYVQHYVDQGMDYGHAVATVLPILFKEQVNAIMQPVEPEVVTIIKDLQRKGICVIALTARSLELQACTLKQLQSIDIDFSKTGLRSEQPLSFSDLPHPAQYSHGVMFCSRNAKGKALLQLFEKTKFQAKKIVFIDDKQQYHECVQKELGEQGINDFIGIRYSFLDEKVKNFKLDLNTIANPDLGKFTTFLSMIWRPVMYVKTVISRVICALTY
jgi:hypothetical protein